MTETSWRTRYQCWSAKLGSCVGDKLEPGYRDWEWHADKRTGLVTPEVGEAFEIAQRTTTTYTDLQKNTIVPVSHKPKNGSRDRAPFEGISIEKSVMMRHIVGLSYAGGSLREAFEDAANKFEMKPTTVEAYWYRRPDIVSLAEAEHLESTLQTYHKNLWSIRTMMSDAGPRAVETLCGVMDDPKSSPNIRLKAAAYILKMVNVDNSAGTSPTEVAAVESLRLIKDMRTDIAENRESHIIDADDAEFVEGEVQTC